jgi:hypothetical protein
VPASIVAPSQIAGATTSLVCNKPTGTANGDIMVAFAAADWGDPALMTATGWTLVDSQIQGTNAVNAKIWTKTAGGSEPSTYTFGGDSSSDNAVGIITTRGTTASFLTAKQFTTGSSVSRVAPSISAVPAGSILLCFAMVDGSASLTFLPPAGMTEQVDVQSTAWTAISVASLLGASGTTGTQTFTASNADSTAGIEMSVAVAAAPDAGVPFRPFVVNRAAIQAASW